MQAGLIVRRRSRRFKLHILVLGLELGPLESFNIFRVFGSTEFNLCDLADLDVNILYGLCLDYFARHLRFLFLSRAIWGPVTSRRVNNSRVIFNGMRVSQ